MKRGQAKTEAESETRSRTLKIIRLLEKEYPDAKTALNYNSPLELLVATMLSAQCTDKVVNKVTKNLFNKYRTLEDYARADLDELEQEIRSTGFYRNKAKNIRRSCGIIVEEFDSEVPRTMKEMLRLPGVARKTANVVLSNAYGVVEGIAVDTHVRRVVARLGLTRNKDPEKIEKNLIDLVPFEKWRKFTDLMISHGRSVCVSRKPKCGVCILSKLCPSAFMIRRSTSQQEASGS